MFKSYSIKIMSLVVFLFATYLNAATSRNDVKLLEASEDIKFISQQIAKDYLYLSKNPENGDVKESLNNGVLVLDEKLRLVASSTKSEDTKDILTFLSFSRDEISETLAQAYSFDNGALMLDFSEILLEGAESIAKEHTYRFSTEEKMFISIKNMSYLVERITKYYMAVQAGFTDHNNIEQLKLSIKSFDKALFDLNKYPYNDENLKEVDNLKQHWLTLRAFYLSLEKSKISNIVYMSAKHLEDIISKLELYHSKNQ